MTTGQRIAQKRKELGLSQEALGEKLGVSRQSIYKWTGGKHPVFRPGPPVKAPVLFSFARCAVLWSWVSPPFGSNHRAKAAKRPPTSAFPFVNLRLAKASKPWGARTLRFDHIVADIAAGGKAVPLRFVWDKQPSLRKRLLF